MTSKETLTDVNVIRGMVPANSIRGGARKDQGQNANEARGLVAVPWPSYGDAPQPQTPHCTAITKKGTPCKAAPIGGTHLCIGHTRSGSVDT